MSKVENLNRRFEAAPKPLKKALYIFLIILSVVLLLMSLLLLLVSPVMGILCMVFAVFVFLVAKTNLRDLKNNVSVMAQTDVFNDSPSSKQKIELHSKKILETYDCNVTGIMFIKNGVEPQQLIRKLKIGDLIMLVADPHNKYDDNAVKVCNSEGAQIGWLPKGSYEQLEAFDRLSKGESVSAEVSKIYPFNRYPGNYGLIIDIHFWVDENEYEDDFDEDEDE